jgi:hypothetical protein
MRLEQLDTKLLEWGKAGEPARVVETLRARTNAICMKLSEDDAGRQACEDFLKPGRPAAPNTQART